MHTNIYTHKQCDIVQRQLSRNQEMWVLILTFAFQSV